VKIAHRIDDANRWQRSLGPILYVASVQYFVVQFLVSLRWSPAYSWSRNAISDLGNTNCATFKGRYVCSPLHPLMNVSFVVLGLTMIVGSVLIYQVGPLSRGRFLGFGCLALGGVGAAMVGLFPENQASGLHAIGASLPFLVGNVAIVVLACSWSMPRALRWYSLFTGIVALVALAAYASGHYLDLGEGGCERLVAYPQAIWMIVVGTSLLTRRDHPGHARVRVIKT
jgi:hypothetical membrane protein